MLETYWIYFLIGLIVVILMVVAVFIVKKAVTKPRASISHSLSFPARAKLILPGNNEILLEDGVKSIGRGDLTRVVPVNDLGYISRRHFEAGFANGQHYIEDLNSLNGTKLNGVEIRGQGKHALKDGGQIAVGEVITLIFRGAGADNYECARDEALCQCDHCAKPEVKPGVSDGR